MKYAKTAAVLAGSLMAVGTAASAASASPRAVQAPDVIGTVCATVGGLHRVMDDTLTMSEQPAATGQDPVARLNAGMDRTVTGAVGQVAGLCPAPAGGENLLGGVPSVLGPFSGA
ncbi:hypothetical protein [Streptomyces sp. YIM 98790]|uniref:hypothetical protein n=1 Tax=Streptomyces sp. YIM 98790 TaxID=2689077 RepID=UPI001408EAA2|nr:hypothetical protein [Streptomyces sp. YIM 98790]